MPVEADPLCFSYAAAMMQMDKVYIISRFGTDECLKMGIQAEHLQVGVDTSIWPVRTEKDKIRSKQVLNIPDDAFVMCTVADNQERKNIVAAMDAFAEIKKQHPNSKYVLVTREHNLIGWRLRDYAMEIGISRDFVIVERGSTQQELWLTMASADVFVLPSKAEGLGMPLLEAMAMGIPCVATDACGMKELLADGRGWLIDAEYVHRDPFGNGRRYWIEREFLTDTLGEFVEIDPDDLEDRCSNARKFVEARSWDIPIDMVNKYLEGLNEQKS
jgi:glycosyltransferase involved in cell wall biosynthesis